MPGEYLSRYYVRTAEGQSRGINPVTPKLDFSPAQYFNSHRSHCPPHQCIGGVLKSRGFWCYRGCPTTFAPRLYFKDAQYQKDRHVALVLYTRCHPPGLASGI